MNQVQIRIRLAEIEVLKRVYAGEGPHDIETKARLIEEEDMLRCLLEKATIDKLRGSKLQRP